MGKVWAREPFIASTPDGPVVVSDSEPLDENDPFVKRFPKKFVTTDEIKLGNPGSRNNGTRSK